VLTIKSAVKGLSTPLTIKGVVTGSDGDLFLWAFRCQKTNSRKGLYAKPGATQGEVEEGRMPGECAQRRPTFEILRHIDDALDDARQMLRLLRPTCPRLPPSTSSSFSPRLRATADAYKTHIKNNTHPRKSPSPLLLLVVVLFHALPCASTPGAYMMPWDRPRV
jgi:hypothetical protein